MENQIMHRSISILNIIIRINYSQICKYLFFFPEKDYLYYSFYRSVSRLYKFFCNIFNINFIIRQLCCSRI